jgi:hypothetical protein
MSKKATRDELMARYTLSPDARPLERVDPLELTLGAEPKQAQAGFGPDGPGAKRDRWPGQP